MLYKVMIAPPPTFSTEIKAEALALGFAHCGITAADFGALPGTRLAQWLGEGKQGGMDWMETRATQRSHPQALWPEARTAIVLGMSYAAVQDPLALAEARSQGRISVYAQGKDYHDTVKKALKSLARWMVAHADCTLKVFVDTAPIMEKPLAQQAGLGWQGKHTNMVSRTHGSWLFLGVILTTLELPHDKPHDDRCGSCTACQTVCPTNAFPAPYQLDARRCISYLTIEHKGLIPEEFRAAIGNRIYGCDDCLAVCPWNRFATAAQSHSAFAARPEFVGPALAELLLLDDHAFRSLFAGSPIKRIGRERMVRNVCIAAGNSHDVALLPALQALTHDPSTTISESAHWAIAQLTAKHTV